MPYKSDPAEGFWGELRQECEKRIKAIVPTLNKTRKFSVGGENWVKPMKETRAYRLFTVEEVGEQVPLFVGNGVHRNTFGGLIVSVYYDRKRQTGRMAPGGSRSSMLSDARQIREALFPVIHLSGRNNARAYQPEINLFEDSYHRWVTLTFQVSGYSNTY